MRIGQKPGAGNRVRVVVMELNGSKLAQSKAFTVYGPTFAATVRAIQSQLVDLTKSPTTKKTARVTTPSTTE